MNKDLKTGNYIQIAIAIILLLTLVALIFNLCFLSRQIKLTQVLNQPLCAVKEVQVNNIKDHNNRIRISAVIVNSGNYIAKNASIEWKFHQVENLIASNPSVEEIKGWHSFPEKSNIAILPKHEFDIYLLYVKREELLKRVQGYDRGLIVELIIKYKDMNDKLQLYSCSFLITSVGAPNMYEVTIQKSSTEEQQEELYDSKKEPPLLPIIMPSDASPNVRAIDTK